MELSAPPPVVVACDYCGEQIDKRDLKHHQSFECLQSEFRVMQCPKGCGQNIEARHLDKHVKEECPLELVPCDFQLSGCPRRIPRRARKEHNQEALEYHVGLMNKSSVERDERMAKLEKSLRAREMELQALYKALDREREDRLEMMQQYDDKIQKLLEVYEMKMEDNTKDCKKALNGAMRTANTVDGMRMNVDGLLYDMRNVKQEIEEVSDMVRKGKLKSGVSRAPSGETMASIKAGDQPLFDPNGSETMSMGEPRGAPVVTALRVDMVKGPYYRISEAIRDAKVGDKIALAPGKYTEPIRMNRPLHIVGDGHVQDVIIETSGRDTFVFETEFGVLSGVTLRQKGTGFWNCVDIVAGQLNLEGCDISSQSLTCISIHRKTAAPRIWRNKIHNCAGTGIYVYDTAKGQIEDNDIYENGQSGIELSEAANPEIKFNRLQNNAQHGILVHDNGKGEITDNEVFKNRLAGIEVRESGNPRIHRNKIYSHESSAGIYIHHHGRADIEKNDIYHNSLSGICVWQAGKPLCRKNRISHNGEFGVQVRDGGWGTYADNDLRSNARGALLVTPDCKLKVILERNLID